MMKLLPLVAAAVAEKRFLTAKASDVSIDATNNQMIFDADLDAAVWTDNVKVLYQASTNAISPDAGALTDGQSDITLQHITTVGSADATAAEKKRRRAGKEDTTAMAFTASDTAPDCANKFVKAENKAVQAVSATFGNAADISVKFADTGAAANNLTAGYLYFYCNHATKCGSTLASGTVYKVACTDDSDNHDCTLKVADGTGSNLQGAAGDSTFDATKMYWIEQAEKTAPAAVQLCSTAKASGSRSAAFVAGIITWALLA